MKRFVCLFLVISLVFACSGSAFAAPELATGSALSFRSPSLLASSANDGSSSSSPLFVSPTGGMTYYYFNGSQVTSSSTSGVTPSFEKLFSAVTTSIANSVSGLSAKLYTPLSSILSYVTSLDSSVGNIETYSNNIKLDVSGIRSGLSSLTSYVDDVESILNSGVSVDLGSFVPYFMPSSSYNFNGDAWRYWWTPYIDGSGNWISSDVYDSNFLLAFKNVFLRHLRTTSYVGSMSVSGVRSSSSSLDLTSPIDLSVSNTGVGNNAKSIWFDLRSLGSNLSSSLARLAYVLANDDDIEAREASSSVRQAYTNDFLQSSGSASASASDFGTLATGSSSVSDSFQSSYGASDALSSLTDLSDGRWDWFSQSTMDNLNSSRNRSSSMLKSNRGYTNFYEERYREIKHD